MKRFIAYFITANVLGLLSVASYGQNLLTNGSFELGQAASMMLRAGSNNLPGWTLSGDKSLYWVTPSPDPLTPPDGTNYLDLNGAAGSITLSQSFPTTPGQTYEVSFSVGFFQATNGGSPDFLMAAVASSNGVTLTNVVAPAPNVRGWASPTKLRFVATTVSSTLHLTDTSATVNYDLTLDAVSVQLVTPQAVFADYNGFDINAEMATGVLNGVSFTLLSTRAAPRPGVPDDGGVVGAITSGGSIVFNNAGVFTPALAAGDELILGAASDFHIAFAQPITNVTVHVYQLEANRLSFRTNGVPAVFSLVSSDGDFTTSAGNTAIQGSPGGGDDASGSLLFTGAFTELSWTSAPGSGTTGSTPNDGIRLQLSVAPETLPRLSIHSLGAPQVQLRWGTNFPGYVLESSTVLPATNWVTVTNNVSVAGEHFSVTMNAQEAAQFFRLLKN